MTEIDMDLANALAHAQDAAKMAIRPGTEAWTGAVTNEGRHVNAVSGWWQ